MIKSYYAIKEKNKMNYEFLVCIGVSDYPRLWEKKKDVLEYVMVLERARGRLADEPYRGSTFKIVKMVVIDADY